MLKLFLLTTELIVGLMQQAEIIRAIVVERNLHIYYRIPAIQIEGQHINPNPTNKTQLQFIIQCPYKATLDITLPKDMKVCVTVGQYEEKSNENSNKTGGTIVETKSILNTKVDYVLKQKPKNVVKRPIEFKLRPIGIYKKYKPPERKKEIKLFHGSNIAPLERNCSVACHKSAKELADRSASPALNDDDAELSNDYSDDGYSEEISSTDSDRLSFSPLKYLNVKDAITKFRNGNLHKIIRSFPSRGGNDDADTQAIFAEHTKYHRGNAVKGYNNMYHRDESYWDHIFYDDLDQRGRIGLMGRARKIY